MGGKFGGGRRKSGENKELSKKGGTERKRECPKEGCIPSNYPSIKNKLFQKIQRNDVNTSINL